ncbi:MAG: molecular chaperone TorD family protein [Gallionella sp.]
MKTIKMNNMSEPKTSLRDQSEFYLILARAFMAPQTQESYHAMKEYLSDDLSDMDQTLGYGMDVHLECYRAEMAKISSQEDLLIIYSRIFLQPPREAKINSGVYLDGAFMGGTVDEMAAYYLKFGLARGDHFNDLPDHVSVQLEFVSYLYAQAADALLADAPDTDGAEAGAGHYLFQFVRRWLPKFHADLEKTTRELREIGLPANPYLPLASMLAVAVARDSVANPAWIEEKSRVEKAMEKARANYAVRDITPENIAEMERKLKEKGLSTEHLKIPVGSRDKEMGWIAKTPPDPRRK